MPNSIESPRKIRLAAVQMESCLGQIAENLVHAETLIEKAVSQEAQLVIFPELAATGYTMSKGIWNWAETCAGRIIDWLCEISGRFHIYVGFGFVETDGEHFYNAYAIASPEGLIAGIVRKTMAETYCFRCARGAHVVESEFGRIGVGICADNHFVPMVSLMQAESVDLMLMPHAWPGPFKVGGPVSQADIDQTRRKARGFAPLYARFLGVPAVFVNASGPLGPEKWSGILGSMLKPDAFRLYGLSTVVDSDGEIKGELEGNEDMIIAEVTLDPHLKRKVHPQRYGSYGGGWIHPIASPLVDVICGIDSFLGRTSYRLSSERRQKANERYAKNDFGIR